VRPCLISITMRVFVSGEYRCDAWKLLWSRLSLSDGWLQLHGSCGKGLIGIPERCEQHGYASYQTTKRAATCLLGSRESRRVARCALGVLLPQKKNLGRTCTTFSQRQACRQEHLNRSNACLGSLDTGLRRQRWVRPHM